MENVGSLFSVFNCITPCFDPKKNVEMDLSNYFQTGMEFCSLLLFFLYEFLYEQR